MVRQAHHEPKQPGNNESAKVVFGIARAITPLVAALVVIASSIASGERTSAWAQQSFSGIVSHVADGDTLDVTSGQHTVTIRLDGIDAPERGQPFSAQARTFLRVLAFSQRATVHPKDTDRYGRLVARVVVGGKDLSEEMVAAGLAWHYVQYSADARLGALEKQAREKRRGLWSDPTARPPWDTRRPGATAPVSRPRSASPGTGAAVSGPFHGNVSSRVYHAPGCSDYNCKNCRMVFATRQQAEAAGYRPHRECVFR